MVECPACGERHKDFLAAARCYYADVVGSTEEARMRCECGYRCFGPIFFSDHLREFNLRTKDDMMRHAVEMTLERNWE